MRAQRSATIVASAASSSSSSSSSSSAPTPQNRGRIIVPVAKKQLVGPSGAPLRGASAAASAVVAPDRAAPKDGPLVLNGQVSVIGGWESEGGRREREAFARTATTFNDETTPRPCPPPAKRTRAVDFFAARARPLLVPVLLFRSPVRPGTATRRSLSMRDEPRASSATAGAALIVPSKKRSRLFFSSFFFFFRFVCSLENSTSSSLSPFFLRQKKKKKNITRSCTPSPPSASRSSAPSTTTSRTRSTRSSRTRRPAGSPPTSSRTRPRPTSSTRSTSCASARTACPTTTSSCSSAT